LPYIHDLISISGHDSGQTLPLELLIMRATENEVNIVTLFLQRRVTRDYGDEFSGDRIGEASTDFTLDAREPVEDAIRSSNLQNRSYQIN
jgi:hypothetical protein